MKISKPAVEIESNYEPLESQVMTASPRIMVYAVDNIYKNKRLIAIQETISNALDIHDEIGQTKKIDITLPTLRDPRFICRDYGTGLDEYGIKKVSQFGASDKAKENKSRGAFGLGFKSPCGLCDSFIFYNYINGTKETRSMTLNRETFEFRLNLHHQEASTDPAGVEVCININPDEINSLYREFFQIILTMPDRFNILNNMDSNPILKSYFDSYIASNNLKINLGNGYFLYSKDDNLKMIFNNIIPDRVLSIGDIVYKFPAFYLNQIESSSSSHFMPIIPIKIGDINISADRENIEEHEKYNEYIKNSFFEFKKLINNYIESLNPSLNNLYSLKIEEMYSLVCEINKYDFPWLINELIASKIDPSLAKYKNSTIIKNIENSNLSFYIKFEKDKLSVELIFNNDMHLNVMSTNNQIEKDVFSSNKKKAKQLMRFKNIDSLHMFYSYKDVSNIKKPHLFYYNKKNGSNLDILKKSPMHNFILSYINKKTDDLDEQSSIESVQTDKTKSFHICENEKHINELKNELSFYFNFVNGTQEFKKFKEIEKPKIADFLDNIKVFDINTHEFTLDAPKDFFSNSSYKLVQKDWKFPVFDADQTKIDIGHNYIINNYIIFTLVKTSSSIKGSLKRRIRHRNLYQYSSIVPSYHITSNLEEYYFNYFNPNKEHIFEKIYKEKYSSIMNDNKINEITEFSKKILNLGVNSELLKNLTDEYFSLKNELAEQRQHSRSISPKIDDIKFIQNDLYFKVHSNIAQKKLQSIDYSLEFNLRPIDKLEKLLELFDNSNFSLIYKTHLLNNNNLSENEKISLIEKIIS